MNLNECCTRDSIPFNSKGQVRTEIRRRVREAIELVLDEELEAALGAGRHERTGERVGYRNGKQQRTVVTEHGPTDLQIPRGRLFNDDGSSVEWHTELLPRYQRRTAQVDEAVLGASSSSSFSPTTFDGCSFTSNAAQGGPGGIARLWGGAIYNDNSDAMLMNCDFVTNLTHGGTNGRVP